jgi:hypothetical protein
MDVGEHQAIDPDLHATPTAPFRKAEPVNPIIVLSEKRLLPPVAHLDDIVRGAESNYSWYPRHFTGRTIE